MTNMTNMTILGQAMPGGSMPGGSEWIIIVLIIAIIWYYRKHSKSTKDKSPTNSPNKSNVNLLKNIIQIAVVIQIVLIGITVYKLFDAEAFKTYPETPYGEEYANDNRTFIGDNPSIKGYGDSKYDHFSLEAVNINGLKNLREERRSEAIKPIITSIIIETCLLWLVVFLIKRTKHETNK